MLAPRCLREEEVPVLYDKIEKVCEKKDTVKNVYENITGNLDFVKISNFIRGDVKAVVHKCSGVTSHFDSLTLVKLKKLSL